MYLLLSFTGYNGVKKSEVDLKKSFFSISPGLYVIVHIKKTIAQLKLLFNCALIKSLVRIVKL